MKIPEFHLIVYNYASRRCNSAGIITYQQLKEVIRRVVYRPNFSFYAKTAEEMEYFNLLKEITGDKKLKKYRVIKNKEIRRLVKEGTAFPIEFT